MEGQPSCIVVAVDGSELLESVLEKARALSSSSGVSKCFIVHVLEVAGKSSFLDPLHDTLDRIEEHEQREATMAIRKRCDGYVAKHEWKEAEFVVVQSDNGDYASTVLTKFAEQRKATLLIVGQGKSVVDHFLLGSNSLRLARDHDRPFAVLIVKSV